MINDANMWARLCLCLYDSQSGCESGYLCLYGSNAFRGQRQKQPGDRAGPYACMIYGHIYLAYLCMAWTHKHISFGGV